MTDWTETPLPAALVSFWRGMADGCRKLAHGGTLGQAGAVLAGRADGLDLAADILGTLVELRSEQGTAPSGAEETEAVRAVLAAQIRTYLLLLEAYSLQRAALADARADAVALSEAWDAAIAAKYTATGEASDALAVDTPKAVEVSR